MAESNSFLADLEEAVSNGTTESCLRALWHATDILIAGTYSEEEIRTFGEIIGRLAEEIELDARVRLAGKLACSNNAPSAIVNKLASDDSIDVAWPVLRQSERLDVETLVACAKNKGQKHLLAISKRKSVPEAVTDVLVVRGSQEVVTSVAENSGAQFSNSGFLQLVHRSEEDSILAECVGLRKDIPRHLFHQLVSKASEDVKRKLQQERPDIEGQIQSVVTTIAGAIHARFGPASKDYFTARRRVARLYKSGELTEDKVFEFAHSLDFNETAAALSLLCAIPIDVVERALLDKNRESILILAKALNFSWATVVSLLFLGTPNYQIAASDLDRMRIDFLKLNVDTCLRVLTVYRSRNERAAHQPNDLSDRHPN
jgi:uncharacterized protein (DUF2336 family)